MIRRKRRFLMIGLDLPPFSLSLSFLLFQLVSKALGFLSVVVKMNSNSELFSAPETLKAFCERIILPNITMRSECQKRSPRLVLRL